jgi:hypothetical protein
MMKPAPTEQRYAVCIGINQYHPTSELSTLRYAEHDAQAIHNVLGQLGFPKKTASSLLYYQWLIHCFLSALNSAQIFVKHSLG